MKKSKTTLLEKIDALLWTIGGIVVLLYLFLK